MIKFKILLPIIAALSLTACSNLAGLLSELVESLDINSSESTTETSESSSQGGQTSSSSTQDKADYTIMLYLCGSDLESSYGMASEDIKEILSLSCPENVNILIETGGANSWGLCTFNNQGEVVSQTNTYNISSKKLGRYVVNGKSLQKASELTYSASMGATSTLQSFVQWGLSEYPAEQTGLILWNHGAAMGGCCFDEVKLDSYGYEDSLSAAEVGTAVSNAMKAVGRTEKLDWIGYDCCLMSVADIASVNAQYFNYMVASQESEDGYGWKYDGWLPTLYNNTKVSPTSLLPVICDTFVQDFDDTYDGYYDNDQTLSVLDLSKMPAFISAFDTYVDACGITTSSKWDNVKTAYNNSLRFGYDEEIRTYLFGVADFENFLTKMSSSFSANKTNLVNALHDLVIYNKYGSSGYSSTKPCGLSVFVAYAKQSGGYGLQCGASEHYTAKDSLLTKWRAVNIKYGF